MNFSKLKQGFDLALEKRAVSRLNSTAALDQFSNSGVSTAQGEVANNFGGFGGWNTKFRATAVGEFI